MVDRPLRLLPGVVGILLYILVIPGIFTSWIVLGAQTEKWPVFVPLAILTGLVWLLVPFGFVIVSPNETKVVQLFGRYMGTMTDVGLFWGNPFYFTTRVSQRMDTFETGQLSVPEQRDNMGKLITPASQKRQPSKVNDREGTPIEIAAIVVWKVVRPAEAVFAVKNYKEFVQLQSEAALRNLASRYSYDPHGDERSLRGHTQEIAEELKSDLHDRLNNAGLEILDARISHLAYSAEIAAAMLQRQQATAIVAARQIIVHNAVGMVEMALEELQKKNLVDLDAERRAAMVSNLLVVLCSHSTVQPVVNTGTIYS
ncbi:SPFH domain-containing protein [Telmatocola sphagniphila]|uniref:SPFH domain-containing protein n=1 Tax=Telmatocola sphagniphila TaxID=1123043 RepID=A0A8E6EW27_9BACT|nr:SPFH domain-containing protein [Telmatocola sphagniphila]QVL30143.1 SPFH domain-containing protein [Telmatocola sphagniphila]